MSQAAEKAELRGAFPQRFLSDQAAQLFVKNFQLFGDYIKAKSGIDIKILLTKDFESLKQGLDSKELDFCFGLADLEVVELMESSSLVPFATVSPFKNLINNGFKHYLVVNKNEELASDSGWNLKYVEEYGQVYKGPPQIFAEMMAHENRPFKLLKQPEPLAAESKIQVLEYGQSKNLILEVLTTPKLAAVVDEEAYLLMKQRNPKIGEVLEIVASTEPIPIQPIMIRSDLTGLSTGRVKKALLSMHQDPEGEEILKTIRMGKWVDVGVEDFEGLKNLVTKAQKMGLSLKREHYAAGR